MQEKEYQALVNAIASRVEQRVAEEAVDTAEHAANTLVVYTGAELGFDDALRQLSILQSAGCVMDIYLSDGAKKALRQWDIDCALGIDRYLTELPNDPVKTVTPYELVIVPALTVNSAAKLAQGIMDTPATQLILTALMLGKKVVIARDGACPDCPMREQLGFRMTAPLKTRLRDNLLAIKSYGAVITDAAHLADAVQRIPKKDAQEQNSCTCQKRVVSRQQVLAVPENSTLTVAQNSIVTRLAQETAQERGVTLVREP